MSEPVASPSDLETLLGSPVDPGRALFILQLAQEKCETVVSPLTTADAGVVLDVALRAYANPTNAETQAAGPFNLGFGAGPTGGLWLTKANKADLRRAHGGGGAFTIDPMPADAGGCLPWWDSTIQFVGDWDATP